MRVYLDMCCLKRPFDDQSQARIRLESEAVLALLSASGDRIELVRSSAHDLENDQNPVPWRAAVVRQWLTAGASRLPGETTTARTAELMALGFGNFDAFHLACAEEANADTFVTCDDRLERRAVEHDGILRVRVANPLALAREVLP